MADFVEVVKSVIFLIVTMATKIDYYMLYYKKIEKENKIKK